ncbi:carotenoid oxygenase family protein [filamentous cyanobacterium LEGE 11480]|uniref:Carotenoid oxygenase family protein n=1 Tax=Romeriopsis navalis LEGE 11480 TaxID=2777977 RepID=A0A928VMX8_9CYAN|nr:carotenoid oxygenase family protein [Romeriopsis navalis]MBE9031558.1 carotenoid oxygenase family protein [Romeriopsis navalis LEGE 11480]
MTQAVSPRLVDPVSKKSQFPRSILSVRRQEHECLPLTIKAGLTDEITELSPDLVGHLFVVGPAGTLDSAHSPNLPHSILPAADGLTPLYNGDGKVYRVSFEQGKATLKTKIAESVSCLADRLTHDNPEYKNLDFQNYGITRGCLNLGVATQLSVTLTPFRFADDNPYRLLLSVDMGRPYEIDPVTLKILQPIGFNQEWKGVNPLFPNLPFKLMMSAGHPSFDFETKELFTVNLGKSISTFLPTAKQIFSKFPILNQIIQKPDQQDEKPNWLGQLMHQLSHRLSEMLESVIRFSHRHFHILEKVLGFMRQIVQDLVHDDFVDLIRWRDGEALDRWRVVLENGHDIKIHQTLHQMWATKHHIVLLDTAFKISLEELMPYERGEIVEDAERLFRNLTDIPQLTDTPVYIIKRKDLVEGQPKVTAQQLTIPREIAHYVVDYDDSDGIVLHTVHSCATDAAETIRRFDTSVSGDANDTRSMRELSGMLSNGMDRDWIGSYILNPGAEKPVKSYLIQQDYCWGDPVYAYRDMTLQQPDRLDNMYWLFFGGWEDLSSEYVAQQYADYKYRTVDLTDAIEANKAGQPTTLCRVKIDKLRTDVSAALQLTTPDVYQFPAGHFANSPQFIPKAGTEGSTEGYLTCVVLSDQADGSPNSEIWIFDAENLSQGPVYRLCSDSIDIGFTIHTTWLPEIVSPEGIDYDIRKDFEPVVSKMIKLRDWSIFPYDRRIAKEMRSLFEQIYQTFNQ